MDSLLIAVVSCIIGIIIGVIISQGYTIVKNKAVLNEVMKAMNPVTDIPNEVGEVK